MPNDYSNRNLQKASFKNKDLRYAVFSGSDLRGTDFTGADLTGASLTNVKTGITPINTTLLFLVALAVSLFSGYVAMLSGQALQLMLSSKDQNIRIVGIVSLAVVILFIAYFWWKGGQKAIRYLIIPMLIVAAVTGVFYYTSGLGTGEAMLYQILALALVAVMFVVGTIARAAAGTLSNILFIIVALSGGMFGRSVGGGIGTVVMATACMQISKRALSGAKGFEFLQRIASLMTSRFGTSFRQVRLANANFSGSKIHNADFSGADVSTVTWGDSRKINSIINDSETDMTRIKQSS